MSQTKFKLSSMVFGSTCGILSFSLNLKMKIPTKRENFTPLKAPVSQRKTFRFLDLWNKFRRPVTTLIRIRFYTVHLVSITPGKCLNFIKLFKSLGTIKRFLSNIEVRKFVVPSCRIYVSLQCGSLCSTNYIWLLSVSFGKVPMEQSFFPFPKSHGCLWHG